MAEDKSIKQILEDVFEDMCNNYCKYPYEYNPEDHDGVELWDSEICDNCPLSKLV